MKKINDNNGTAITIKALEIPKPAMNGESGSKYPKNGYPKTKPTILAIIATVKAAISIMPITKSSGLAILLSSLKKPFMMAPKR